MDIYKCFPWHLFLRAFGFLREISRKMMWHSWKCFSLKVAVIPASCDLKTSQEVRIKEKRWVLQSRGKLKRRWNSLPIHQQVGNTEKKTVLEVKEQHLKTDVMVFLTVCEKTAFHSSLFLLIICGVRRWFRLRGTVLKQETVSSQVQTHRCRAEPFRETLWQPPLITVSVRSISPPQESESGATQGH